MYHQSSLMHRDFSPLCESPAPSKNKLLVSTFLKDRGENLLFKPFFPLLSFLSSLKKKNSQKELFLSSLMTDSTTYAFFFFFFNSRALLASRQKSTPAAATPHPPVSGFKGFPPLAPSEKTGLPVVRTAWRPSPVTSFYLVSFPAWSFCQTSAISVRDFS